MRIRDITESDWARDLFNLKDPKDKDNDNSVGTASSSNNNRSNGNSSDTANSDTANSDTADSASNSDVPTGGGSTGNARIAMSFFIDKGLSPAQAAGVVGNLQAESGSNLSISAVGDGGQAIGIAQWHPDRRANFQRAFGKPFSESTFRDQLNFIWWEFQNTERSAFNRLRRTTTATQAAAVIDQYYERSSGAHRRRRMQYAAALAPSGGIA